MEENKGANWPHPAPILADQAPRGPACQHEYEDEDQQDMTHADVQLRSHRDAEVEQRWQREEQDLAPTSQLPSCDGINDQRQEDQRGQCRLDHKRQREVEPNTVGVDLPENVAGPGIGYRADIG